uniref:thiamine biosynthesis protein S n=1 Tax=Lithothamnion corallioides TaxID=1277934 RepID=UPI0023F36AC6|nr:thiamine biosynthesis protein S [Lithothamnion corallioides]WEA77104.1 thiamine biosynthesis protein S [Lithothamnion corallioides]
MFTNYIFIQLNGKPFNCLPNFSLRDILTYLDFDLDSVIVEYNSEIIHDSFLDTTIPVSGDRIEVLTIVGGG